MEPDEILSRIRESRSEIYPNEMLRTIRHAIEKQKVADDWLAVAEWGHIIMTMFAMLDEELCVSDNFPHEWQTYDADTD